LYPKLIQPAADLVTETDKSVESFVSSTLRQKYPTYSFIGEETYQPGTRVPTGPTFIVDPIDGTTNFIHGHPSVSISLGFSLERRATVGVVYNPFTGHMYHAIRGQGAYVTMALPAGAAQGEEATLRLPLRAPERLKLSEALVGVEWGSERHGNNWRVKSQTFAKLAESPDETSAVDKKGGMTHGLRSGGSAALNLCAVAAGELDAYWEGGCWAWDVCAGWIVLEEAGGHVLGANPGEWEMDLEGRRYLAVRRGGAEEDDEEEREWKAFVQEFWGCVVGRLEY
jgi:myo-inositol-1(or 4)-monophosphatase